MSGVATIAERIIGGHLLKNHLTGAGIGTLQSLVGGLGTRFAAGFCLAFYWQNAAFRAGVDSAIAAVVDSVK